jgi:hypothetical protein
MTAGDGAMSTSVNGIIGEQDTSAKVKNAQRVFAGISLLGGALLLSAGLVSLIAGHDTGAGHMSQVGSLVGTGMVIANAAYGVTLYGKR